MKKPRNRKLLIQIGVITLLIFTVTFAWFILTDYSITEKSFLSAKHEMIDRDLNNISSYVPGLMQTDWFWHYAKEHSDDNTCRYHTMIPVWKKPKWNQQI